MNTKRLVVSLIACSAILTFFCGTHVSAQTRVAIVDVGTIFKQHPTFAAELERLQQEAAGFRASTVQAQQGLAQEAEGIKQNFDPNSADFKKSQTELAQRAAALQVEQGRKMQSLMEREATLHFHTYEQVKDLIERYCDAREIQLVLRYNSQKMDPSQPSTVMQQVNGSVVYHNPSNDITGTILAQLGVKVADSNSRQRQ